jgi:two-component system, OmpR family, phosphate regulon sensor histidine kinase PhoR
MGLRPSLRLRLTTLWPALATLATATLVTLLSSLWLGVAAGVGVMVVAYWLLDQRLFRPLAQLVESADRLTHGGFGLRVEVPDQRDLGRLAHLLNRLSQRAEEQLADLEKERDQLRSILASMGEGVLVTGPNGRAWLANPSFHRMFHLRDEVARLYPLEICRQPQLAQVVEEVLTGHPGPVPERRLETAEGLTLVLTGTALAGNTGAVVVVRDVTDEDRVVAMRRDFVANVSHELKTPLAAIRGMAETLRDGARSDPAAAERFLDRILVQCHRLQALLQDLLTLSRLETLQFATDKEPVDLALLVHQAHELTLPQAAEKGVRLRLEVTPVPHLHGLRDDLERLVLNLLENAIKYNRPEGEVTLRLGLDAAAREILLEVQDTGIGIPLEAVPRLFERFYRVDKGRSRDAGGTGLGLSIVKHVTQAHGGEVEVQSTLGKGSRFTVRLPVEPGTKNGRP